MFICGGCSCLGWGGCAPVSDDENVVVGPFSDALVVVGGGLGVGTAVLLLLPANGGMGWCGMVCNWGCAGSKPLVLDGAPCAVKPNAPPIAGAPDAVNPKAPLAGADDAGGCDGMPNRG
jgi:hypothetical protein